MNYYIEKHDMEIILDALEHFILHMKNTQVFHLPGSTNRYPYSVEEVEGLFQSLDNSFHEDAK